MIMVDDDRNLVKDGETPEMRKIRFRILGRFQLTAGVYSDAKTFGEIVQKVNRLKLSGQVTRFIHCDKEDSVETKKTEGYF